MSPAAEVLAACCDDPGWVAEMVAGAPYSDEEALLAHAAAAFDRLGTKALDRILATHPPLGTPPGGSDLASRWSQREQASLRPGAELAELNEAYRERFGHVFLICATGLSTDDVLAAAQARLGNDEATERVVVARELREIVLLRLRKAQG